MFRWVREVNDKSRVPGMPNLYRFGREDISLGVFETRGREERS